MPAKNFRPVTTNLEHLIADKLERKVRQSGIQRTELLRKYVNFGLERHDEVLAEIHPKAPPSRASS